MCILFVIRLLYIQNNPTDFDVLIMGHSLKIVDLSFIEISQVLT